MKKVIVGNWKMNKTLTETIDFLEQIKSSHIVSDSNISYGVGVPFVNLKSAQDFVHKNNMKIDIYAQNVHQNENGAFTGEVSISMLKDINIHNVIIGHSERREYFNETNEIVNKKVLLALKNNFKVILCCGETLNQFESHKTNHVIEEQINSALHSVEGSMLSKLIIAYEPVWAIGTGKTATNEIAQDVIAFIRSILAKKYGHDIASKIVIQYGGSVKPTTINELLKQKDINGALVGGASLETSSFIDLVNNSK